MAAVSSCPKCDAQVSLPRNADPGWQVRCPLCHEEFPLRDALAKAPPELIVVDRSLETPTVETAPAQTIATPEPAAVDQPRSPFQAAPERLAPMAAVAETAEPGLAETPLGADAQAVLALKMARAASADAAVSARGARRRHRHAWIGRLAGVVGGGIAGLAIGYVTLLWIGGPRRDFLQIGPKLPPFLVPATFRTRVANSSALPGSTLPRSAAHEVDSTSKETPQPAGATDRGVASPSQTSADRPLARAHETAATAPSAVPLPDATGGPAATAAPQPGTPASPAHRRPPVRPAPVFSAAASQQSLAQARAARHDLATGNLVETKARRAMGNAYRQLCRLAETVTFPAANADPVQVEQHRRAAAQLMLGLTQRRTKQRELALIADRWIDSPKRSGNGVVLVGRVQNVRHTDGRYMLQIDLAGQRSVAVVAAARPPVHIGDQAIVLGSIVQQPAEHLAGYRGDDTMVVWAGLAQAAGG